MERLPRAAFHTYQLQEGIVDKLYYNANIYSIDEEDRSYSAVGVKDGKIAFLGSDEEAAAIEARERIDLEGKTVLPGLIDSHLHMLNYAFVAASYKMFGVDSIGAVIREGRTLVEELEGRGPSHWLYGRGWNDQKFTDEKRQLNRYDLDRISTTRPILFIRVCGHAAAVNSKALEIVLGLEDAKHYAEQIDAENGILREAAVKLCYNAMNEPTVEQIKEMILSAQADFNRRGITSVESDNFLSLPGRNRRRIVRAYEELDREGRLTVRIREQASFTTFEDMKEFIDDGYRTGQGSDYYSIGPIKLYEDGSLGARTALLNEPYSDEPADGALNSAGPEGGDSPANGGGLTSSGLARGPKANGIMVHDEEDLQNCVDYAYEHNMQILIHSIGDRSSDIVCTAYENAIAKFGKKESRLAINHLQIVSEDLFDRMKKNDILAYIQPVFVASDQDVIRELIGEKREKLSYAWKTMMDKGLLCCGSSDSPVESYDVLTGIQIAVTRDRLGERTEGWHPEQKLSVRQAVRLFTINNAYGAFEEHKKGSLELGKLADLTVLDADPFQIDAHDIADIAVLRTVVGGKDVFIA